jgi:opacity protein-like surface antigen
MRWKWVVGVLLVTIAASTANAEDKPWSRAGRLEAFPTFQFLGSDEALFHDVRFSGGPLTEDLIADARIKVDDTPFFGGGMGYNLNDHFNLNAELVGGRVEFLGHPVGIPELQAHSMTTLWLGDINLDYNILKSRLTPLVTGGAGFAKWRNHDKGTGEVHWDYNLGAGVRWDMSNHLALRVIYRATWTEMTKADEPFRFGGIAASLIYMFD